MERNEFRLAPPACKIANEPINRPVPVGARISASKSNRPPLTDRQPAMKRRSKSPPKSSAYFFAGYTATASISINQSGLTRLCTPTVERAVLAGFFSLLKNSP